MSSSVKEYGTRFGWKLPSTEKVCGVSFLWSVFNLINFKLFKIGSVELTLSLTSDGRWITNISITAGASKTTIIVQAN